MSVNWIIIYSIIIIIIGRNKWLIERMNCVVVLPDHLFCSLQEDFRSSWLKVTSSASSLSTFPAARLKSSQLTHRCDVAASVKTTTRVHFPSLSNSCQVWRDRQHQPGARQEDGEVQRLLLHLLRGPEEHRPGCGQLQRHQGDERCISFNTDRNNRMKLTLWFTDCFHLYAVLSCCWWD